MSCYLRFVGWVRNLRTGHLVMELKGSRWARQLFCWCNRGDGFYTYMRVLQTSYFKVGEKEPEMNFSRYPCLRSIWLFPHKRWHTTVNTCRLHSRGYALLWWLQGHDNPKNDDFICSMVGTKISLLHLLLAVKLNYAFLGNWKENCAKLPNVGFSRQRDSTAHHSHGYISIETIHCDSVIGCSDFLKTVFLAHFRKRLFVRWQKPHMTKADLCQSL